MEASKFKKINIGILIMLGFFILSNIAFSQTMDCKALVKYRDNDLVKAYDKASAKMDGAGYLLATVQEEIKRHKELAKENDWGGVKAGLKMGADAISDLAGSYIIKNFKSLKSWHSSYKKTNEAINKGKMYLSKDVEKAILEYHLDKAASLVPGVSFVKNQIKGIMSLNDYKQANGEIVNRLKKMERDLKKVKAASDANSAKFKVINDYNNYISEYLSKNCK